MILHKLRHVRFFMWGCTNRGTIVIISGGWYRPRRVQNPRCEPYNAASESMIAQSPSYRLHDWRSISLNTYPNRTHSSHTFEIRMHVYEHVYMLQLIARATCVCTWSLKLRAIVIRVQQIVCKSQNPRQLHAHTMAVAGPHRLSDCKENGPK